MAATPTPTATASATPTATSTARTFRIWLPLMMTESGG
jgi:hypothetical protein